MFGKKSFRQKNEINAGSMADIAFLLLIFFLVTTTIDADKGIRVLLPPWVDDITTTDIPDKNVLSVKVNATNQLLVEGEIMNVDELKETTKTFIMNPMKDDNKPNKPSKAVVSIQNDRGTEYDTYIDVYNEIKAAYNELWNEAANKKYGMAYNHLASEEQKEIRKVIPLIISEAEPTNHQDIASQAIKN